MFRPMSLCQSVKLSLQLQISCFQLLLQGRLHRHLWYCLSRLKRPLLPVAGDEGSVWRSLFALAGLQSRQMSQQPEHVVYSGPQAAAPKHVSLRTLQDRYSKGEPISMVTAYDYPSAVHVTLLPPSCTSTDRLPVHGNAAAVSHASLHVSSIDQLS